MSRDIYVYLFLALEIVQFPVSMFSNTSDKIFVNQSITTDTYLPDHVSHEYKASLNSILGYVQLINDLPGEAESIKNYVSAIAAASRSLVVLTECLEFSTKLKNDTVNFKASDNSLEIFVQEVSLLAKQLAEHKGIKFNSKLTKRSVKFAKFDYSHLYLAVANVVENAFKFSDDGNGLVELIVDQLDEEIIISVSDTGIGMSEAKLDECKKAIQNNDAQNEFFGLGMSVSLGIVSKMQGKFSVISNSDSGSMFTITIPYIKASEQVLKEYSSPKELLENEVRNTNSTIKNKTILIADSNEEDRNFVEFLLKRAGYSVTSAENAELAIAFLNALPFDLLLLDVSMQDANGQLLYKKVIEDKITTTVIGLVDSEQEEREKKLEEGYFAFIQKPIKLTNLLLTVKESVVNNQNEMDYVS